MAARSSGPSQWATRDRRMPRPPGCAGTNSSRGTPRSAASNARRRPLRARSIWHRTMASRRAADLGCSSIGEPPPQPIIDDSCPTPPRRSRAVSPPPSSRTSSSSCDAIVASAAAAEMYPHARSLAVPACGSRRTAAAGECGRGLRPYGPDSTHTIDSCRFRSSRVNQARMEQLVAELRELTSPRRDRVAAASTSSGTAQQGKLPVRERIERCSIAGSPFLELSPLAALRHVRHRRARARASSPGIGRVSGREAVDRRERRDGEGRHVLPDDREEARACAADRARQPAAVRVPRGLRRRVPAASGRGVSGSRALRPDLLQPGAHVRGTDPAGRHGDGLLHRRRRVRARDVGRNRHRQGHGHDLPGRAAAREGRDGRRSHRRRARRRRRPHPRVRRRRLLRGRRRSRAAAVPDNHVDAAYVEAPAGRYGGARGTPSTTRRSSTAS